MPVFMGKKTPTSQHTCDFLRYFTPIETVGSTNMDFYACVFGEIASVITAHVLLKVLKDSQLPQKHASSNVELS